MTDKSDKGLKAKVEAHNAKSKHKVTVGILLTVHQQIPLLDPQSSSERQDL